VPDGVEESVMLMV